MPEDFDACANGGGMVLRVSGPSKQHGLKKGEYWAVCFDSKGMHYGEVKRKGSHYKKEDD